MSVPACLHLDHRSVTLLGTDRAFSAEGIGLTARVADAIRDLWTSETVGGPVRARHVALREAVDDCAEPNWDGYGAEPANELSAAWAEQVLAALPGDVPTPEVAFDPSGDTLLEWAPARGRMLSLSVGRTGELRFALRTPAGKLTGIEVFADELPGGLAHALKALVE